jgi:hypothetical protein
MNRDGSGVLKQQRRMESKKIVRKIQEKIRKRCK